MSKAAFSDDCPGCRPVLIDIKTGKSLPNESPIMMAVNAVWASTTLREREAFHRFTCLNSRELADLQTMQEINAKIQAAVNAATN